MRHSTLPLATVALLLVAAVAFADEPAETYTPPDGLEAGWYARIETSMGRIVARV